MHSEGRDDMISGQPRSIPLGSHWSYNLINDPKRLGFVLARYSVAARFMPKHARVLELGCSEGIGVPLLTEGAEAYLGVDMDREAIAVARTNWSDRSAAFHDVDFLGVSFGAFDAVISLDVVEHIAPETESVFFRTVHANLGERGVAVVGTPNVTAAPYASAASNIGHVNLFSAERLRAAMEPWFRTVFILGVNDEIMHVGFSPMMHYLLAVGCGRKEAVRT